MIAVHCVHTFSNISCRDGLILISQVILILSIPAWCIKTQCVCAPCICLCTQSSQGLHQPLVGSAITWSTPWIYFS